MEILKIIFAIIFILFLPGHIVSYLFFPVKKIDFIERIALSFTLSIAVVPLMIFYLNLLGVPITLWTVVYQILLLLCITSGGLLVKVLTKR